MPSRHLDSLVFSQDLYDAGTPAQAFSASTREEAEAWQSSLRQELTRLLGGFPRSRCALRPEIQQTTEFETYTRETILFQSRENLTVFAYFLQPQDFSPPGPCILCLPGHGRGVESIVGGNEEGGPTALGPMGRIPE